MRSIASSEKNTANKQKSRLAKQLCNRLVHNSITALSRAIKQRIRVAQIKAAISANRELILLYWDIGRAIVDAQKDKGYGKRVVEILSADLRREFPEMAGLSALNLWRMRAFYLAYAVSDQKLSQLVTESDSAPKRKLEQSVLEARVQTAPGIARPKTVTSCDTIRSDCYRVSGFATLGTQHRADAKSERDRCARRPGSSYRRRSPLFGLTTLKEI